MSRIGDVEIEGLDELIAAFMKLPDEAMNDLTTSVNIAGNLVLQKAKDKVSVKSGELKRTLKFVKAKRSEKKPYKITGKITSKHFYMNFLELGHRIVRNKTAYGKVEAKPFLRPAADESKQAVADIITESMNKSINEMGGKK